MILEWQHLPSLIDPIALSIGSFSLYFYSLFWILGACFVFLLMRFFFRNNAGDPFLLDVFLWGFFGALFGGRIGFILLYQPSYFFSHPGAIFSPFNSQGDFMGISGMSFFGGLLGVIIALMIFFRTRYDQLFFWFDRIALCSPAALFFGRIGNFFNGELVGRVTDVPWGMYFASYPLELRHPSQLYEAFFEGIVLFFVLYAFSRKILPPGFLSGFFLIFYAIFRFFVEFFREPDLGMSLFFGMTISQLYCLLAFFLGVAFLLNRKNATLRKL